MTNQDFVLWGYLRIHNAIRKNAETYAAQLSRVANPTAVELGKLKYGFNFHWQLVEEHHTREDNQVFPLIAELDTTFAAHLNQLTGEHYLIQYLAKRIKSLFVEIEAKQGSNNARIYFHELIQTFKVFQRATNDHLAEEEPVFIPAITTHFSREQQRAMETDLYVNMSLAEKAVLTPFEVENLAPELREDAVSKLPLPLRENYADWKKQYYETLATFQI
jgi:iron-sulfur cluster repair protein YtfE (RIC family)